MRSEKQIEQAINTVTDSLASRVFTCLQGLLERPSQWQIDYEAIASGSPRLEEAEVDPVESRLDRAASRSRSRLAISIFGAVALIIVASASALCILAPRLLWDSISDSRLAYADATFSTLHLPSPYADHRFSFVHANVMKDQITGQDFLEVLAFLERECLKSGQKGAKGSPA